VLVLPRQAQYHDAWILLRRVGPNIREIDIKGQQGPALSLARVRDVGIDRSSQPLIDRGYGIETGSTKNLENLCR
jgi:hypothetical protein